MTLTEALESLFLGKDLRGEAMAGLMRQIMAGELSPAQIAGLLVALRCKGETVDEIAGAAAAMREVATPLQLPAALQPRLVDTCGTGGDAAGLFNVSTASAIAVAAAGGVVAKHGNRSVSSSSGSADVLSEAGVRIDLAPDAVARCVAEIGIGFLFAPTFHPAMKHAIGPRRELGVRTIFNLLGPLTNPAAAPAQVLGVFDACWVTPMAQVLSRLGSRHVLVVHGSDGLDEVSIAEPTQVAEARDGEVRSYTVNPEDFGIERQALAPLRVDDAAGSLTLIRQAFAGEPGPAADMIALNGGAAVYVAGLSESWTEGVTRIRGVLADGSAAAKLAALVERTRQLAPA